MTVLALMVAACAVAAKPAKHPPSRPAAHLRPIPAVSATVAAPGTPTDRFGIVMLYPTIKGGREWSSRWDNGKPRALVGSDPDDPELSVAHGDGTFYVDGRGVCIVGGRTPRLYVVDPDCRKMWQNVEITVYGMRIAETAPVAYAGLMAYARTDHQHDEDICGDRGYGGRLLYDGRADFEKEVTHHLPNGYVQVNTVQAWQKKMPVKKWFGIKFVVRNAPGAVRLELWRDRRNGRRGGAWEKLGEWLDRGAWGLDAPPCAPGVNPAEVLTEPAPTVYVRNDEVQEIRYKWFSVREIEPVK